MMQSPAFHGAMADSPLPAVALSPCVEEKQDVRVAAVSSPASPPFGLRAAVAAAIATFPERRRGLKDVSNSLAPAKSPAQKPQPSPSPVRAVSTLRSSGAFSPAGASPRTKRESVGSTSEFSETGSDTPLHTERAIEPTTPKTPVASPAAPLLMTPPPRSPKLDAPFSELGKFPELAPAAPPAPARRVPVTLAALVVFVALGAAVVVTAPPPVAPVAPVAAPAVTRKAIVLRAQTAALKPVPKVKPAMKPAAKPAAPKAKAPKTKAPKAKAPAPKAKKPAQAAAKQPGKGPLARALAPAHALVKAILALALPVKVAFCAAAAALAILA
jgi:hypothetical protein